MTGRLPPATSTWSGVLWDLRRMCHPPSPLRAESNSPMDLSVRSAHLGTTDSKRVDAVSPGGVLSWQTAVYHALVPSSRAGGYILSSEHHIPTPPRIMGSWAKDPESNSPSPNLLGGRPGIKPSRTRMGGCNVLPCYPCGACDLLRPQSEALGGDSVLSPTKARPAAPAVTLPATAIEMDSDLSHLAPGPECLGHLGSGNHLVC